jgi:hypothetical protein
MWRLRVLRNVKVKGYEECGYEEWGFEECEG